MATVLVYSSGAFNEILGFLIFNESLGWKKIFAVLLCLAGCVLVSGAANSMAWQANPIGINLVLSSGLLYTIYSLMGRQASIRGLNPWKTLFYTFLFAAGFLWQVNIIPAEFFPAAAQRPGELFYLGTHWRGWVLLLLLAIGPTLFGFGL